jgi:hypothetical protein
LNLKSELEVPVEFSPSGNKIVSGEFKVEFRSMHGGKLARRFGHSENRFAMSQICCGRQILKSKNST